MLAYGVSFGLVAVSSAGGSFMFGFICAYFMLVRPLMDTRFFEAGAAQYMPVLITGWINIVFLATVAIGWRGGNQQAFKTLRTTTLLMIPFCWIVLYRGNLYPREGHVLWIGSMVIALFSVRVFEPFDDSRPSLK
jgi:hypothetical protein